MDFKSLRRNVREALNAGVAGFLVPAMASEVYKLSETERQKMVDAVLETAGNSVIVIAGAGETEISKAKHLIRKYICLGCNNILFQIPYRNEEQFKNHFMELAELGPEMIMLQDWDPSGYGLPDELICDLFENIEAFRCLKIET
ncbi:MAG: dihydrodipicolinate synthase family protein, partial [Acidobacteriota bacterium]